jgi:MoxR-vWA-beta-propeller ternary system domain bpX0/MoxR-vWA-beta-propeller ternary system domain bpX1
MDQVTYFLSSNNYFWQWEDDQEVIAIPHERTIVYREYILSILEKLAPQGLPPFGSILLVLLATNPDGDQSIAAVYKIISDALKTTDDAVVAKGISFLKMLNELPPIYKEREKRIMLMQTLFQRAHNRMSVSESQNHLAKLRAGKIDLGLPMLFSIKTWHPDFRTISLLADRFSSTDEILSKMAGIMPVPETINTAFDTKVPTERPTDFIEELIENSTTFRVGSLIKRLWGGLNIPLHSNHPSEQPIGGISDLTNKGDFDKLLISEFAYDDISFLSRLANNEALYIHREIPPVHNDFHRIILIDSTLQNWGTPRTVAFSIMLAIAKHPKTDIPVSAFVLGRGKYYPISYQTIHEVIDSLQLIETGLHCATSLELFLKENGSGKEQEIILLSTPSTLRQSALQKSLLDNQTRIRYQIWVTDQGQITVLALQQKGYRQLQQFNLPLTEAWKNQPKERSIVTNEETLTFTDYPILFKLGGIKKLADASDGEIFALTEDRSIFRCYDKKKERNIGWELVCSGVPFKADGFEVGLVNGQYIFLLFSIQSRTLLLLNSAYQQTVSITFDVWATSRWSHFIFDTDHFVHSNKNGSWQIALDGELKEIPDIGSELFEKRTNQLLALDKKHKNFSNVFRNITNVYITIEGYLALNKHVLAVENNHIKLTQTIRNKPFLSTRKTEAAKHENVFLFKDGSEVHATRIGIIVLRSSDKTIPDICIPSILESSLGLSAGESFAGNVYYRKFKIDTKWVVADNFYDMYVKQFVRTIINYGA